MIQDPTDPEVHIIGCGDRVAFEKKEKGEMIWMHLPKDFGSSGYYERRQQAIERHFQLLPRTREELLLKFDYWIEHSAKLRQYLWAHRPENVATARKIASILPVEKIIAILQYLLGNYWKRYCGWPDLLIYNESKEYFFVEVKASKDKLSEDQKNWIYGNTEYLHLPFKIVKIHRKEILD